MTLEPWLLVAATCTAVGALALTARQLVSLIGYLQERRLARQAHALQRWWSVLGDVPADVLTPPLRRLLGRIMVRRLEMAARANPDHPFLRAQREEISRFTGGAVLSRPIRSARSRGHAADRARHIRALEDLLELLDGSAADRLVSAVELASGVAAVSRALTELEFLASHQATVETDALRRMTRAIGKTTLPLLGAQSSRAFPTQ